MIDKNFCVYKHTSPNGKVYIGITCQKPKYRWANGKGYKESPLFYNAIKKYGWENFEHEVLFDNLSEQDAKQLEIDLISKYKSNNRDFGYNITSGGDGALGRKMSEESKDKIRKANSGKHPNEETRAKMSKSQKGRKHSEETRKKISEKHKGMSYNKKQIYQIDTNTNKIIKTWDSIKEASEFLGISKSNIQSVCYGKTKTAGGFTWQFVNEHHEFVPKIITRKIVQLDKDTNSFVNVWDSIKEATMYFGGSPSTLSVSCKKNTVFKGFRWMYYDDYVNFKDGKYDINESRNYILKESD